MKIERRFTQKGHDPYEGIKWEERVSEIRNPSGEVLFRQEGVVVPSPWSQMAADILAQKYFRRAGVPRGDGGTGGESDAREVFHRLAHAWRVWGERAGYFDGGEDAEAFYCEALRMLASQMAAPNSPQWFNTGLYEVYGIKGPPQGHFYVEPASGEVRKSESAYERPQPHACFILNVEDDLVNEGGIMDLVNREARLFKYGSGTGSNFSRLRGEGESLSGGGISSGLLSFLKIADRSAAAIKSGGTTRRAAKMVTLDADHPDIEKYTLWKAGEEYKVSALAAGSSAINRHAKKISQAVAAFAASGVSGSPALASDAEAEARFDPEKNSYLKKALLASLRDGVPAAYLYQYVRLLKQGIDPGEPVLYTTDWTDEAYNTVSGQASNNSVRISEAFMAAVRDDADWNLTARTGGAVVKTVKARALWDEICRSAWKCADPGLQFHTTINEWHTCPQDGEIRASNPCSEYMFLDDTACNLASLNLMAFYDMESGVFRIEDFCHAIKIWTLILEISVVMAQFPSKAIAQKSYDYRTLGLGYANLGSLLMVMGLPYSSGEGRALAASLTAILTAEAYAASALLAQDSGPFARFAANREAMLRVIRNHRRAAWNAEASEYEGLTVFPEGISPSHCPGYLLEAARKSWDRALQLGEKHGYRNAQVTAIAPTGTIGLVMDCDTTGVEPDFALVKYKKLSGGGSFKIINQSIPPALKKLSYTDSEIAEITAWCRGHGELPPTGELSTASLKEKGFGKKELAKIAESLKTAFSLEAAFQPGLFSRDFLENKLGLAPEKHSVAGFSLLRAVGFTARQIEEADAYVTGTLGVV
ncbi:MAG: adenosylcobalamin-dependent ribonucleoside-diphosphate reductase, partial [Spirochaetales bacterium]|nr:adenosylcobalamin-dependent ribonucleoside-diphosphate reductase [Spirochaetales bacterium]